ncbi:MAG: DegV family protein [Lachnospiraceae bacterium]|nr:DegV family protein [Lachnospiraceae bacterium]
MENNTKEEQEKIAVITDSCADVPEELVKKYNIFVLPMVISCEDGVHRDGVDIHAADVYEKLKTELPKTSSPMGSDIVDTLDAIKKQGYQKAVAVLLSGGLSGTINHFRLAVEDLQNLEVAVFDSFQGSIGIGAIALQAAEYIRQGFSFEEIKKKVEKLIQNTKVFFSIDTMEFLQKGGRIGKATALAGAMLRIKPILSFDEDGEIYAAAKVRGHKMVESKLIQLVQERQRNGEKYNIVVADGGAPEDGDALEIKMKELFPDYQFLYRAKIGAALSVYLGSGLLGAGIQFIEG